MLGESNAIADFSRVLSDPGHTGAGPEQPPSLRKQQQLPIFTNSIADDLPVNARTQLYMDIFRQATEIYLLRARAAPSADSLLADVDHFEMPARVTHMRSLFERVEPDAEGAHILVWPGFVTAAEARKEDDRRYFAAVLQRIWETTGYANVRRGLDALPGIWARQGGQQRWTAALPELRTVVM